MSERDFTAVGAVMTRDLHVVDGLASVREALDLMNRHGVSSLVIDRRHEGDEFGIVTVREIAEKVVSIDRSVDRTSVYEVMRKPVLTVSTQMNIKYAIRLLTRFGVGRALVTDEGRMVGLVTLRDMTLRAVSPPEQG